MSINSWGIANTWSVVLTPINLLQVGASPVVDVKYSVDGISLSDVELRVGNTVVWRT